MSLVLVLAHESQIRAQSKPDNGISALPSFEVVSVKPYPSSYWPTFSYKRWTPDGFIWRNTIAQDILVYAYNLRDPKLSDRRRLIPGGEKWMFRDWFDVQARMSDANIAALSELSTDEREVYKRQLLQSMLADRFKLKMHRVTVETPGWELVVAKNGPKNMKRKPDNAKTWPGTSDLNHIQYQACPVSFLAGLVEDIENAPVFDKTGLTGKYDFDLEFSRGSFAETPPGVALPPTNDSEPTIREALKDQLGLELVPIRIPLDEIVIDHIEKPSPN
jgi:uncharacterized protein (TIGR03435 family)